MKVRPGSAKSKSDAKGKGKGKARAEDVDGHTDEIWALALTSDGRYLASGGKDRRIGVWDVGSGNGAWVKGFGGHKDSVTVRAPPVSVRPGPQD